MRHYLIYALWLIIPSITLAQPSHQAALLHLLNPLHTMTAQFTQTVTQGNAHGQPIQRTQGTMALMRPGHFRWSITHPSEQLILLNQNNLWIYDADLNQVIHRRITPENQSSTPAALLSNPQQLIQQFHIQTAQFSPQTGWLFTLRAQSKDNAIAKLTLHFTQGELSQLQFTDRLGQHNQLDFTHRHINPRLNRQLFTFTPPQGADIINDERKTYD